MKDLKKIQLALSIALLKKTTENELQAIQERMQDFQDEVGAFLGLTSTESYPLNRHHVKEQYALQFENCTLDVDLVSNVNTQNRSVQSLRFR